MAGPTCSTAQLWPKPSTKRKVKAVVLFPSLPLAAGTGWVSNRHLWSIILSYSYLRLWMKSWEAKYAPIKCTQLKRCQPAISYLLERTGREHPTTWLPNIYDIEWCLEKEDNRDGSGCGWQINRNYVSILRLQCCPYYPLVGILLSLVLFWTLPRQPLHGVWRKDTDRSWAWSWSLSLVGAFRKGTALSPKGSCQRKYNTWVLAETFPECCLFPEPWLLLALQLAFRHE